MTGAASANSAALTSSMRRARCLPPGARFRRLRILHLQSKSNQRVAAAESQAIGRRRSQATLRQPRSEKRMLTGSAQHAPVSPHDKAQGHAMRSRRWRSMRPIFLYTAVLRVTTPTCARKVSKRGAAMVGASGTARSGKKCFRQNKRFAPCQPKEFAPEMRACAAFAGCRRPARGRRARRSRPGR